MRPLTLLRAVAWVGVAVTFWSLNVLWGDDPARGKGPPGQWERHVTGAALLAFVAALSISVSGRRGTPPGWLARGIGLAACAGIMSLALWLRREATTGLQFEHLLVGPGWTWMFAGGGLVTAAVVGTLGLKRTETPDPRRKKRRR